MTTTGLVTEAYRSPHVPKRRTVYRGREYDEFVVGRRLWWVRTEADDGKGTLLKVFSAFVNPKYGDSGKAFARRTIERNAERYYGGR